MYEWMEWSHGTGWDMLVLLLWVLLPNIIRRYWK